MKLNLVEPIKQGQVACTTDLWTEDMTKKFSLDYTLFRIGYSWTLKHSMMRRKVFKEERKTSANIREEILQCFKDFGLISGDTPVTADAGKNLRPAFKY